MDSKKKAILNRIKHLESAITKAQEYLDTGDHAHWHGFRPRFDDKMKDGKIVPPHKDWVKKWFLPNYEKALKKAYDKLEKLN